MSTPCNAAASDDIAGTMLMLGDPLRAKFTAETHLENPIQFNTVRSMFGYTGTYKGKKVSVTRSSMGMTSIGIYSYKLYKLYEVENIIRIGSAGACTDTLKLFDPALADSVWNESIFAEAQADVGDDIQTPSAEPNVEVEATATRVNKPLTGAKIHSSGVFYHEDSVDRHRELFEKYGCVYVEVGSFALFHNAKILNKCATCLLIISDSLVTHAETTAQERQTSFHDMVLVALETTVAL